jgi:APA family basic amino acid/polyamine antiporter
MDLILQQAEDREHQLRRSMGVVSLTAFGVAAIIGAGIFVLTGVAAATAAGPAIILSYVMAGIVSALAALCYAEFASTVPIAGSAYTYSYAVLGELIAWIIGWDLVLEYGVGSGAVASGWSGYFTDFLKSSFGWTIPKNLANSPFSGGIINLPAFLIILLITGLLIIGTREASWVTNLMVAIKLAIVGFFIVVAATHVHTANWHNFAPFGWSGIASGASLIFFAYIGFDQISTAAEEVRDPQRTMPRGILLSLGICTVLYVAVSGLLTLVVSYTKLNNASPVSHTMLQIGLNWAATIISIGAIIGLTTVLLVLVFGQSRIFFSMSRDGLLPAMFSRVHPSFRTPYVATTIVGIGVALLAGFLPIDTLARLTNIGTLAAFILVSIAVWRLRYTQPNLRRGFRLPFVQVIAPLTAVASVYLIFKLPVATIIRFVIWLVIGLVVYFLYSRYRSQVQNLPDDYGTARRAEP